MSVAGWIFMITFWGIILGLNAFCYAKILKHKDKHGID